MRTIFPLSQDVITKIAAGEVIERPAYAVKELLENAIDAHADYITIHIEEAGLKKIVVTDNGIGMSKEDILECFKPHTTSKLSALEQLHQIRTLGFRGEALASIAAISKVTIRSRQKTDKSGTEVSITNGEQAKISPVGLAAGTTIIAQQLFHAVPARKNFLKTQTTELRHIIEIVSSYALAFPHVRFFLTHHNRTLLDLPKNQNITERIKALLGGDIFEQLVPLSHQNTHSFVTGFLAKPQISATNTSKQFIFINNRRVYHKDVSSVLKHAYGNLLEPQSYPIVVLFFTLPAEMIDVNIHPRKELVDIAEKKELLEALQTAIEKTLTKNNITFRNIRWKSDPLYDETLQNIFSPKKGLTNSFAGNILKDNIIPWNVLPEQEINNALLQVHNLYIVKQTKLGVEIVDQHAAHERILFEQYSEEFLQKRLLSSSHKLPNPIEISLSPSEIQIFEEYKTQIEDIGFSVSPTKEELKEVALQSNTLLITHIPIMIKDKNSKKYFRELLEELSEKGIVKDIDSQNQKMLAYLACRSAIKRGDTLDQEQMQKLIEKLKQTKNNVTCPHGRPTTVEISLSQLNLLFKRR